MNELTPIIIALAALVNTVYGVAKGNIAAFFNLLSPLLQLKSVDFSKLKADVLALTQTDLATLEKQFEGALVIPDHSVLLKIEAGSSALIGAIVLGEQIVTTAFGWYNQVLGLIEKVKGIFATSTPVPVVGTVPHPHYHFVGFSLPAFMTTPIKVPVWLMPIVMSVITTVVLPALAVAFPAEAPLIADLIAFLKGGGLSPRLQSAHTYYHANP